MSNPLADMEKPEAIFCIGTNMTECHPVAATRIKRAVAKGARMVVADPRRIPLAELAEPFEDWRRSRATGRERIPPSLWDQAVALSTVLPCSRVARRLRGPRP